MKATKRTNKHDEGLSKIEKSHMNLVQEARNAGVYKTPKSKKDILHKATELALKRSVE